MSSNESLGLGYIPHAACFPARQWTGRDGGRRTSCSSQVRFRRRKLHLSSALLSTGEDGRAKGEDRTENHDIENDLMEGGLFLGGEDEVDDEGKVFESILDLPRDAVEMDDLEFEQFAIDEGVSEEDADDVTEEEAGEGSADEEDGVETRQEKAPFVPGGPGGPRRNKDSPNIDWAYWSEAGPKIDGIHCPGCGIAFQSEDALKLGYLRADLLENMPDLERQESKPTVCERCHKIKYMSGADSHMTRQGILFTKQSVEGEQKDTGLPPEFIPEETEKLIGKRLRRERCVVLYLVDVADFNGTCLSLTRIVGTRNPVVVGVNKADLLPMGFSQNRLKKWIVDESKRNGLEKIYEVFFLDSVKGKGVKEMFNSAYTLAMRGNCDIYVVGAANVGKSSFINDLLQTGYGRSRKERNRRSLVTTTSVVPGTTLNFIPISTGDGMTIYDSPGLLLEHSLVTRLTAEEARCVVPSTKLATCGFRFVPGRTLFFGGLAQVTFEDGPPFLANWFCSSGVKVHLRTTPENVDQYVNERVGTELYPPVEFDENFDKRWEWEEHTITLAGTTWKESCGDIAIAGLGWMSVTVSGKVKLRVRVPKGVKVCSKPSLLPYEAVFGTGKYVGSKWMNTNKDLYRRRERQYLNRKGITDLGFHTNLEGIRMRKFKGFPM